MKPIKGLYTDCAETDQPEGTYRFAKNVVSTNILGTLENEKGFSNLGIIAPYTIIGIVPTGTSFAVFSTDNTNCEIGSWSNGVYTAVYNNPSLGFSTSYPIKGEFRQNVNGERVVAFISDNGKPRIINLDNPAINSLEDTEIFQAVTNPVLSSYAINDTGGSLPTGAYVIITKYTSNDGTETNWFVHDKVFYINDDSKSDAFNNNDGCDAGTISSKSISLTFSSCDTAFDNIVIGYIQSKDQVLTPYQALTKSLPGTTVTAAVTGSETSTKLALAEVLTANASYNNAKAITQVNGQLVLANLTSDDLPELQSTAMNITVNYNVSLVDVMTNFNNHKDSLALSLMPGDVYALYLEVELNNGNRVYYHIPGRAAVSNERDIVTQDGLTYTRFQVEDTSNYGGASNNLGFWENANETYPNNAVYGSLAGQKVRHHRMPTTSYLVNTTYSGDTTVGVSKLPRIGLTVSNVNIPLAIQSKIRRWGIAFAKKDTSNSLIVGNDLLHLPATDFSGTTTYWSTGGNWIMASTPFPGFGFIKTDGIRIHALDLLKDIGQVTPTYTWMNYKLRRNSLNTFYTGFGSAGAKMTVSGLNRGTSIGTVIDYTTNAQVTRSSYNTLKKLSNFTYMPQNSSVNRYKNLYNEGCFVADVSAITSINTDTLSALGSGTNSGTIDSPWTTGFEETVHMEYRRVLSDVHSSFLTQDTVPMEGFGTPDQTNLVTTSIAFNGGDTFLCYMSYFTGAPLSSTPDTSLGHPSVEGVRVWRSYVGYSRNNWNYRQQDAGDVGTYYYGKTDVRNLFSPPAVSQPLNTNCLLDLLQPVNKLSYNNDYSYLNNVQVGVTYDPNSTNQTKFPTTIAWSIVQGEEAKEMSWRTFPAGNRYVMPRNKGDIINIAGINNRDLLIHHTYSLFRTRTDAGVQGDGVNIYLKSNDLFAIRPEEIVSANTSYAGTQNKFGCLLTKVGYFFVDDSQGKVFLYNGESRANEISSSGLRIFFRDNMKITSDNPFTANGYTLVYDEYYNRLLITKKQGATSWTVSYNPITNSWVSFHDYTPDYMFSLVNNQIYSLKSGALYQHNIGNYSTFYSGTVYPFIVDVVHNPDVNQDKVFTGLSWLSESYNGSGQLQYTDTLTNLTVRSLDHCSGKIDLSNFAQIDQLYSTNIRNLNRVWYFNEIRDIALQPGFTLDFYNNYNLDLTKLNTNMSWFDQRKFTDKFVICRHEYSNASGNRFLLLESNIDYRDATK